MPRKPPAQLGDLTLKPQPPNVTPLCYNIQFLLVTARGSKKLKHFKN